MTRVAIVVQRCHEDIVGGSETLAWHYAQLLRDSYEIDLLTTTAVDTSVWANTLAAGPELKDGVRIVRFPVTIGRSVYWAGLQGRLHEAFGPSFQAGANHNGALPQTRWTIALQEDFIRHQGPYSEPLLQFIRENWRDYSAVIFITYLYPTTYFGLQQVPAGRALFAPTLHDELPAYLPAYKYAARRARELVWLTAAESQVGRKLWGELPGRVVAMAIETEIREPQVMDAPYLLYSGRIDPNKGCRELFEYFLAFKKTHPGKLRLIITGIDDMPVPEHEDIEFRGFVNAEEKFRLMAGATLFVIPSPNESFSIVTLEAMAQKTPVLANNASTVLADHIKNSGAGCVYGDYESFARALDQAQANEELLTKMGDLGREYVLSRYQTESVRRALIASIESSADEHG
jgi:glycosyltransferase involved in cell wall biosynthesis